MIKNYCYHGKRINIYLILSYILYLILRKCVQLRKVRNNFFWRNDIFMTSVFENITLMFNQYMYIRPIKPCTPVVRNNFTVQCTFFLILFYHLTLYSHSSQEREFFRLYIKFYCPGLRQTFRRRGGA
jgi:hypothetical protein